MEGRALFDPAVVRSAGSSMVPVVEAVVAEVVVVEAAGSSPVEALAGIVVAVDNIGSDIAGTEVGTLPAV